ncbi:MAG: NAD-dependent epimerase/dehydratase family protein [Candidatus Electrothrix scaldis]|nr:MAG: NAD-dependent epimerase/dehydratase family protein [Candidatus Electrothrix sp. GW3-3]
MIVTLITGTGGLVGSEAVKYFHKLGHVVIGIDNDMRKHFFGNEASTEWNITELKKKYSRYIHYSNDIRDNNAIEKIFSEYGRDIKLVIHAAAQPSHDWAAKDPFADFSINANGTLNLLENTRLHAPDSVFIFTSTNKVYGDKPNQLPLIEQDTRWEIDPEHEYRDGIPETMAIDQCTHSLFGASKVAADILTQEYGRYFGMKTGVFRGGCLTGPNHSGAELHGFLAYLMKCAASGQEYSVFGYKGKQVRDNLHSFDLIKAFHLFYEAPRIGEVYNIGGGRENNCSMKEAIEISEKISGKKMRCNYVKRHRTGDHIWWVSDISKFREHYPKWKQDYTIEKILEEVFERNISINKS